MLLRTLGMNFIEQIEADAVISGAELHDFLITSRFLRPEVIAGKAQDAQPRSLVLLVQLFQSGVLGGIAAVGGDVNDQQDIATVLAERLFLPVDRLHRDIGDLVAHLPYLMSLFGDNPI